jgi:hypothetical protein
MSDVPVKSQQGSINYDDDPVPSQKNDKLFFFRVFFRVAADGVDLGQINMELFDEV